MANEKRKRQIAIGGLIEDNPLTSGATTLTSGALAAVTNGVGSTEHLAIVLDPDGLGGAPEIAYITALTAAATSATIVRGQEGTTARQHVRDVPWIHGPTLRDYVQTRALKRTAGDVSFSQSTTWTKANALFELAIPAWPGDLVQVSLNAMASNEAQNLFPDVVTLNGAGGTAVTYWGSGGTTANEGVEGWVAETGVYKRFGAAVTVGPLASGDVVSGVAYVTMGYRTNSSGGTKTLFASATNPLFWSVTNLGPESA